MRRRFMRGDAHFVFFMRVYQGSATKVNELILHQHFKCFVGGQAQKCMN